MSVFRFPDPTWKKPAKLVKSTMSDKFCRNLVGCEIKHKGILYDVMEVEEDMELMVYCRPADWRMR